MAVLGGTVQAKGREADSELLRKGRALGLLPAIGMRDWDDWKVRIHSACTGLVRTRGSDHRFSGNRLPRESQPRVQPEW